MTDCPSLLIQFDGEKLTPSAVFFNGRTDEETAKLQEIAGKMMACLSGEPDEH